MSTERDSSSAIGALLIGRRLLGIRVEGARRLTMTFEDDDPQRALHLMLSPGGGIDVTSWLKAESYLADNRVPPGVAEVRDIVRYPSPIVAKLAALDAVLEEVHARLNDASGEVESLRVELDEAGSFG